MIIRILGKRLRIDLRIGEDCPGGHTGPCDPTDRPKIEASGNGQFDFGFAPIVGIPPQVDRGSLGQRPAGAGAGAFRGAGCGVLQVNESAGRFHARGPA